MSVLKYCTMGRLKISASFQQLPRSALPLNWVLQVHSLTKAVFLIPWLKPSFMFSSLPTMTPLNFPQPFPILIPIIHL